MVHRVSAENTVVRDWFQEPATAIARCSIMAKLERSKFPARPVGTTLATVGPFLLLFGLLYAAFGAASPFLPALMEARGIQAEQIGIIFGVATAIRLISAPVAGRIADRTHALRTTLAVCAIGTALAALGYLSASGFWALLVVSLLHALALAPTTNLADALAVVSSKRESFEYGWARGAGSAAFIVGSIAAGFAISAFGIWIVVVLQAILMLAVPVAVSIGSTGCGFETSDRTDIAAMGYRLCCVWRYSGASCWSRL